MQTSSLFQENILELLFKKYREIPSEKITFFWALILINLLSFGYIMSNLVLNHDDVQQSFYYQAWWGTGRWMAALIQEGIFQNHLLPFLTMSIGILLMLLYGFFVCRIWAINNSVNKFIVIAVLTTFPYMSNLYAYKTAQVVYPLSFLLTAIAFYLSCQKGKRTILYAGFIYMLAFACYQVVLGLIPSLFAFLMIFMMLQQNKDKQTYKLALQIFSAVLLGAILYYISLKIVYTITDYSPSRYQQANKMFDATSWINLKGFIDAIGGTARFLAPFMNEHYYPTAIKSTFLFLLSLSIYTLWKKLQSKAILAYFYLCLAIIGVRSLQIIHPHASYHNLTLLGYALFSSGILAIIYTQGTIRVKNIATILVIFLLLGYTLENNKAAYAQVLTTNAEFHRANRILSRLEQLPQYANNRPKPVAIIGKRTSLKLYKEKPFLQSTGIGSELMMSPSRVDKMFKLLRVKKIYRMRTKDKRYKSALKYAKKHHAWPHPSSVAYLDGFFVIILDNNKT